MAGCAGDPAAKRQKYIASGDQYFNDGEFPHAIIEYRNAVGVDATSGEARKKLADAYARAGNLKEALESYIRAADLLPQDFDVQLTAGTYLLAARRWSDAFGRADVAIRLQPRSIQALVLRGYALAGLNSFDEALEAVEEAIKLDPSRGASYAQAGAIEMARGRRAEAETAFKKAVSLNPKSPEPHLALGHFYWSVGQTMDAEQSFRKALEADEGNQLANRAMAALTIATGRYREAEPFLVRLADNSFDPRAVFALADYYTASGRAKEAIARLEALGRANQNVPELPTRLARAYAASGDTKAAKSLVEKVLASNSGNVDAQLLNGELLLRDGHREEAFSAVRTTATANPTSAEAQFALGRMYAARGDVAAATAAFREVLRLRPGAYAAQVEVAKLQTLSGNAKGAVQTAAEAVKSQSSNLEARLTLVQGLLVARDFARAERELSALRAEHPDVADVHVQTASLALLKNEIARARSELGQAQEIAPQSIDLLGGLIALDLKTRNPSGAKARIEERMKLDGSPGVLLLAARTYVAAGDLGAAERTLRKAIETDPSLLPPYEMLGRLYVSQKRLNEARVEFDILATKQANPVPALTMSGLILHTQGNLDLARQKYREALAKDSRAVVAANNLAWMNAESGENLDEALQLAQTATAAAPETPELMDTLGWVYYKKGLPELAIPLFNKCVEKAPTNASYHYRLGLSFVKAGDSVRGRRALQKALGLGADEATKSDIRRVLSGL